MNILRRIDHQLIGILSVLVLMGGLLFSRAMMSIGMIGLLANALINGNLKVNAKAFWENKALVAISSIFVIYLLSGFVSENMEWYADRLRMKLPLLLLPFAVVAIPGMSKKAYYPILYLFFGLITLMCFYSLLSYIIDFENINAAYETGKIMPTPVQHIRFSLMVAFSVGIGWYLFKENFFLRFEWEKWLVLGATVFLILFLHLLAVRSGLLALYGVLAYFFVAYIIKKKQYFLGLGLVIVSFLVLWIAIQKIPTLNSKYRYTLYSVNLFLRNDNIRELSDSRRLASIQAGLVLGQENLWTGVGVGDIRDDTNDFLRENYPALVDLELMPHNQFIFVFAACGILGLLWFSWAVFMPLFYKKAYKDELFVAFHIVIISSFIVEHTIEAQIGTAFYSLFLVLGLRFWMDERRRK